MIAEYSSHLYWVKYGVITLVFGVWIGLAGYKNISSIPCIDLLHSQETRSFKKIYQPASKKEALDTVAKIDAKSN